MRYPHPISQRLYIKSNRTLQQKYIYIINWGKLVLQIEEALFYYKLGQLHYYKLGQVLLQIGVAVTIYGDRHYKIGQLLQIGAKCITKWGRY